MMHPVAIRDLRIELVSHSRTGAPYKATLNVKGIVACDLSQGELRVLAAVAAAMADELALYEKHWKE